VYGDCAPIITNTTNLHVSDQDKNFYQPAGSRIHVERAIGRLKCFRILDGTIPLKNIKKLDDVLIVCACLCNLDKPLVVSLQVMKFYKKILQNL
jgi:hypothetical protein